jgi:hypothetical protein
LVYFFFLLLRLKNLGNFGNFLGNGKGITAILKAFLAKLFAIFLRFWLAVGLAFTGRTAIVLTGAFAGRAATLRTWAVVDCAFTGRTAIVLTGAIAGRATTLRTWAVVGSAFTGRTAIVLAGAFWAVFVRTFRTGLVVCRGWLIQAQLQRFCIGFLTRFRFSPCWAVFGLAVTGNPPFVSTTELTFVKFPFIPKILSKKFIVLSSPFEL